MLFHAPTQWPSKPRGGWPKMTPEHIQAARSLRAHGKKLVDIAAILDVNKSTLISSLVTKKPSTRKYNHIGEGRVDEVALLAADGQTQQQIAHTFEVSEYTVRRFMKSHGIEPANPKQATALDFDLVQELWQSGLTQKEVGDLFGVSQTAVSKVMIDNGIRLMNRKKNKETT
jgi:predicted transcriptional regulator